MFETRSTAPRGCGVVRRGRGFVLLLVAAAALIAAPAAAQLCEGATSLSRLGGANRFTPPVQDQEALQALFVEQREDILRLLGEAGFTGAADDLFAAVAAGGAAITSFEPGTRLEWMFLRERGEPRAAANVCWAGDEAFDAWEIRFESNGNWYSMIVPEVCGNVSLLAEQPLPQVTLDLDFEGLSCSDRSFDFSSSCANGEATVMVRGPGGSEMSVPSGDASFMFDDEGDYTVVASCTADTARGNTLEASMSETIALGCPSCTLVAEPAAHDLGASSTLTVTPTAGHGAELTSVMLDGKELSSPYTMEMTHSGADAFTHTAVVETSTGQSISCSADMNVAPTVTLSISPDRLLARDQAIITVVPQNGDGAPVDVTLDGQPLEAPYTFEVRHPDEGDHEHTARVENAGGSNEATASMKVDPRWSILLSASHVGGSADQIDVVSGTTVSELEACTDGVGMGIAAEYKLNYRFGIAFGGNSGRCEVTWSYGAGGGRDQAFADVNANVLFAALNIHFAEPGSRVDFWAGPMVGRFDYDAPSLSAMQAGAEEASVLVPRWRRETVLGANVGLKVPFWEGYPLGFYLGAMWFDSNMRAPADVISGPDGGQIPELSLDRSPLYLHAGVSFDF